MIENNFNILFIKKLLDKILKKNTKVKKVFHLPSLAFLISI